MDALVQTLRNLSFALLLQNKILLCRRRKSHQGQCADEIRGSKLESHYTTAGGPTTPLWLLKSLSRAGFRAFSQFARSQLSLWGSKEALEHQTFLVGYAQVNNPLGWISNVKKICYKKTRKLVSHVVIYHISYLANFQQKTSNSYDVAKKTSMLVYIFGQSIATVHLHTNSVRNFSNLHILETERKTRLSSCLISSWNLTSQNTSRHLINGEAFLDTFINVY